MKKVVSTDQAPGAIGPYSQAIEVNGMLFCSGQIPLRPDGTMVEGGVKEQAEQVMENIGGVLRAAGLGFEHIVKTTIFLSSMDHFAEVNGVYGARFPQDPPARSTVAVLGLPRGVDVEIEVLAVRP